MGGGIYVLKYTRLKRIERDMWTDIPVGELLEMTHYRYLYFQEDGRVLYTLTPKPPSIVIPSLRRMVCLARQWDPMVTWGTYELKKKHCVIVTARQPWQHVQLHMAMVQKGNRCCLSLKRHLTSFTGDFSDQVTHIVPEVPFRFVKDGLL